jgi:hypothetical protein
MSTEIITQEDLELFRVKLLSDIKEAISGSKINTQKSWLKGSEVRTFLNIGISKLQSLRISGKLSSSKVGGVHYYRYEDIEKMLKDSSQ